MSLKYCFLKTSHPNWDISSHGERNFLQDKEVFGLFTNEVSRLSVNVISGGAIHRGIKLALLPGSGILEAIQICEQIQECSPGPEISFLMNILKNHVSTNENETVFHAFRTFCLELSELRPVIESC